MTDNQFESIHKKIINLGPEIIEKVTNAINEETSKSGSLDDYKIVWRQLEKVAAPKVECILKENFPNCKITIAKSKSTYPDIKMEYGGFMFAIDIKSNESSKDPWYDIARLDTIEETRLNKYKEEYELVVKYDSTTGKLIKMYFLTLKETVGIRNECNGVKYRPYDGKLRPKTWEDFEENKSYWLTKEEFLKGVNISRKHRFKELFKEHLITLTQEERKEYLTLLGNS